ncbi:MAG: hypothetical protein ACD_80C00180G0013 [uncultured bacterium (gcode 4)]|uniref:Uncharacterized protein n=1 Tax=uncultured bacterium (gcode 4) TaxID=1234023 RepID=K1YH57_9BACT|nr:MAG: hypothetical protein ACD_80C00180G0013 [uncultured bacterium (gcode 4)]HBB04627.1 hypothetical protein [Candidatus Gracilibacteria bacterium]
MISRLSEASKYLQEKINDLSKDKVMPEVIDTILEERFMEKIEPLLTQEDLKMIRDNEDDEKFAENYMIHKVRNYQTLLEETVKEIVTEYITEQE